MTACAVYPLYDGIFIEQYFRKFSAVEFGFVSELIGILSVGKYIKIMKISFKHTRYAFFGSCNVYKFSEFCSRVLYRTVEEDFSAVKRIFYNAFFKFAVRFRHRAQKHALAVNICVMF